MVNHHFWKFLYSILTWLLLFQMEHGYKSQETRRRRVDVEENLQLYRARVIEVHRFQTFAQGGLQTFLHVTWSMVLSRSAFVLFLDFLEANCSEPISPIGYEHVILFILLFFQWTATSTFSTFSGGSTDKMTHLIWWIPSLWP